MKNLKLVYWIVTIVFAGFMIFSSIGAITNNKETFDFITHLGYPKYFVPFTGVAKILGAIAILLPFFNRVKEWAYAGLFFDLLAALYSILALHGFDLLGVVFISLAVLLLFASYFLWHKTRATA